ncbi:MAG: aspartate aminotransferase family protein [Synergistetes bacterium]|nr:MAG: 4-aminobutyrate aminotransferase [bacterium 42_11]MBC7331086.1 aspartate aminotransferase family protein [Synergistota bacterium]MDK2870995.1 4-aminobutyrate aminotransferase / (S)-3-amino-2-methylpropionate transaminase / 5-aminovalerate [bacterium]
MRTIEKYKEYVNTSMVKAIEPVVIERAKGAVIYAEDGKEYIDCFAGIAVVNAGHCNEEVIKAAKEQMEKLIHACTYVYYIKPVADLAEKLAQITPGRLKKTFFSNSGAEANEAAMRASKQFTGKYEFIALQCSFHGRTVGTLSITGNMGRKRNGGPYLSGTTFIPAPYCYRCSFGLSYPNCELRCAKFLEDVIRFNTSGSVAAFFAEPVLGEGGIIVPPPEYFKEIKAILDRYEILFIADEVQSGFGRTGKMFAIEHYGVEPDGMTMAKGIADGFPLGAFIAREELANAFKPGDHLSTFGGNPVSCAAALANIDFMLRENLPQQAEEKGKWFMEKLMELKDEFELVGDIRGKGLMIGIELIKDENKTPALEEAQRLRDLCREKGLLIGVGGVNGNVIRFQPPLVISKSELEKAFDILKECLKLLGED